MPRPQTKADLIAAATENYEKLRTLIEGMSEKELSREFDFSSDEKKKEAHWKRDKNLRDVLIHLYEWHQLLINWIASNRRGRNQPFLPEEYSWKTYGDMNVMFWNKHQNTSLQDASDKLDASHRELMKLMEEYSNEELFSKGVFVWTKGTTLGSYFVSTTSSHYDWAIKKLKAHKKKLLG
ncbi:MAG: ClbS/DfsB family four-helix bundle protein [Lachnospiraceae bacterium]